MNAYTGSMESADAFVVMVEDSFDRIEEVVQDYAMRRIRQMEKQLEALDQDLTDFIESAREEDAADDSGSRM
ncbi:MAG: hypothetical protein SVR04_03330 [Spirochaetota bacterium]|nr:hypothetical protein [Spirochaetota bacterium]